MKKTLLLLLIAFSFASCEKDDICDEKTSTTPRLIIDFYNVATPTVKKNVTKLAVFSEGVTDSITFDAVSTIQLPLKISATNTKYRLVLNNGNTNPLLVNEDVLEFKYSTNTIYVSRACGFKTLFTLDNTNPYTLTDNPIPDLLWMQSIAVLQPNILDENETHLKILF
jgi:Family of unknown function (DUF6452)